MLEIPKDGLVCCTDLTTGGRDSNPLPPLDGSYKVEALYY